MTHSVPRESDFEYDLESGGNTSEEDAGNDFHVSDGESKFGVRWASLNAILSCDGSDKIGTEGVLCSSHSKKPGGRGVEVRDDDDDDNLELLVVDKFSEHMEEKMSRVKNSNHVKQKTVLANPRKPLKPPLPPRGPLLDAGDQKFVKELAELALRKRARIKRMKAVKKRKASKSTAALSSSSCTSLSAMVITIFFFLMIIIHGIRSANSTSIGLMASPEEVIPAGEGLISVQYSKNFITSQGDAPVRQER